MQACSSRQMYLECSLLAFQQMLQVDTAEACALMNGAWSEGDITCAISDKIYQTSSSDSSSFACSSCKAHIGVIITSPGHGHVAFGLPHSQSGRQQVKHRMQSGQHALFWVNVLEHESASH